MFTKNFIIILAAVSASTPVFSQQILPQQDTLKDQQLPVAVVTAQYVPTDVRQTINTVRVLDRKTIEQRGAVNLLELLSSEANIRITQDAILGGGVAINGIRGENVKILIDGVPVTGRMDGNIDAGQLPLGAVQQVEVIEGAQSLMYGSEASAGVVNLISKRSQPHKVEGEVTALQESNGFRSLQARTGVRLGKFFLQLNGSDIAFNPKADTSSRDQLWNPKDQQSGRGVLRYTPNDRLDIKFSGGIFDEVVTNKGALRRPQYKPYAFDEYYHTHRNDASLQVEKWSKNKSFFWQTTAGANTFLRKRNTYRYEFDTETQSLLAGEQDTISAEGYLLRSTIASNRKHKKVDFLAGFEGYQETAEGVRLIDTTATRPGYAVSRDLGIFGSAKWRIFPQFTVQAGARQTFNQVFGSAFSPSAWFVWRPSNTVTVKGSYANGFRSPALKELYFQFIDINHYVIGSPDLQPERSHNVRAELNWDAFSGSKWTLKTGTHGFYNQIAERIILTEFAPAQFQYQNIATWKTTGAGANFTLSRGSHFCWKSAVILTGFYNTFNESNNNDAPDLLWSPDWVNEVSASFMDNRLWVNLWQKTTGKTPYFYTLNEEVLRATTEKWTLLNASIGSSLLNNRVRVGAGVKNLLNITRINNGRSDGIHSISPISTTAVNWGRSYFVTATVMLHSK